MGLPCHLRFRLALESLQSDQSTGWSRLLLARLGICESKAIQWACNKTSLEDCLIDRLI